MASRSGGSRRFPAFAEWLRRQIADRDLTQAEFAERAGVSSATVSRWIGGAFLPTHEAMERIADALYVSVEDVLDAAGVTSRVKYDDPQIAALINKLRLMRPSTERLAVLNAQLDAMLAQDRFQADMARRREKLGQG